jgi:hypothetical protein
MDVGLLDRHQKDHENAQFCGVTKLTRFCLRVFVLLWDILGLLCETREVLEVFHEGLLS